MLHHSAPRGRQLCRGEGYPQDERFRPSCAVEEAGWVVDSLLQEYLTLRPALNPDVCILFCAADNSSGVNSFVTRAIKKMMISTKEQGKDTTIFVVGEKGRSQLSRVHADVSILPWKKRRL